MLKIAIIGCGWLGQPLALALQHSGHQIVATCRSSSRQQELAQIGIQAHRFELGHHLDSDQIRRSLQSDLLILNIPPGGRHIQADVYTQNMIDLVCHAKVEGLQNIVFISTTAVYGEQGGEITESTTPEPVTPSAIAHIAIEEIIKQQFGQKACILRLAGLVGQQRHPARYLSGKTAVTLGQQPVNLVHQADVIKAIKAIIKLNKFGHTYHLCANEHPSRQDYYTWACEKLGLPMVAFSAKDSDPQGKLINAKWTCQQLDLDLQYPSPYNMLA